MRCMRASDEGRMRAKRKDGKRMGLRTKCAGRGMLWGEQGSERRGRGLFGAGIGMRRDRTMCSDGQDAHTTHEHRTVWYPILCNVFRVFGHARLGFTMNPSNKELPLTLTHRVDGAQVDFPPVHPPCIHNTVERHVPTPLPQTAGRPAGQSRTTPRLPVVGSRPSWAL